ncbi:hypothetical protein L2E82_11280 [Cichorium intybus]|uniref:Uncharacterized protein n=1 Tax=Cichorium intybus TaxID=13427 RepID=A0ACB9GE38_CICIN|nr:hypothetical protein L2E82_11280 [Cichorium intybus]
MVVGRSRSSAIVISSIGPFLSNHIRQMWIFSGDLMFPWECTSSIWVVSIRLSLVGNQRQFVAKFCSGGANHGKAHWAVFNPNW